MIDEKAAIVDMSPWFSCVHGSRVVILIIASLLNIVPVFGASFPIRLGLLQSDLNGGNYAITNVSYFVGLLSPTNLMQAGATTNQVLKWDGTNWVAMDDNAPTNGVNTVNGRTGDITILSNDVYTALLYVPGSNDVMATKAPTNSPTLFVSTLRGGLTLYGNLVQVEGTNYSNGLGITNITRAGVTGLELALDWLTNNTGGGGHYVKQGLNITLVTNGNEVEIIGQAATNEAGVQGIIATGGISGTTNGQVVTLDASGMSISPSQISQGEAATGDLLRWSGAAWNPYPFAFSYTNLVNDAPDPGYLYWDGTWMFTNPAPASGILGIIAGGIAVGETNSGVVTISVPDSVSTAGYAIYAGFATNASWATNFAGTMDISQIGGQEVADKTVPVFNSSSQHWVPESLYDAGITPVAPILNYTNIFGAIPSLSAFPNLGDSGFPYYDGLNWGRLEFVSSNEVATATDAEYRKQTIVAGSGAASVGSSTSGAYTTYTVTVDASWIVETNITVSGSSDVLIWQIDIPANSVLSMDVVIVGCNSDASASSGGSLITRWKREGSAAAARLTADSDSQQALGCNSAFADYSSGKIRLMVNPGGNSMRWKVKGNAVVTGGP